MKGIKPLLKGFAFFIALFFLQAACFAAVEDSQCGEHYKFDGLKFNEFYPEKAVYNQGDKVRLTYAIENQFPGPLVDGAIRALVLYRGLTDIDRTEDDDIIDESFAKSDISIDKGDKYSGTFAWSIPAKAKPGIYVINLYYPVKKKFNIAGLTFYTAIPAATTTFEVKGGAFEDISLDKNQTLMNGQRYMFRAPIPEVQQNTPATMKTSLVNNGNKNVDVVYELFNWDDIEARLDAYSKTETVSDSRDLVYTIPGLPAGVYTARITATTGDLKSIMKVRFFIKGAKGRFIYTGLDHFPLMKDDKATIGFCISNSAVSPGDASVNFTVKGTISLVDANGNTITTEQYQAPITAFIDGKKFSFTVPKTITYAKLKADMYDANGNLMDQVELVYDYTKFLNIERNFKLESTQTDGMISYAVKYTDKYNDPIAGEAVVYLIAPDGKVAYMNQKDMTGTLSGEIPTANLAEGDYTLKAVEPNEYLKDSKTLTIAKATKPTEATSTTQESAPETTTPQPAVKGQDNTWMIIVGLLAVIIVIAVASKSMKKK